MSFIKSNLGLFFTIVGMLFVIIGQIITYFENNKLEIDKKKLSKEILRLTKDNNTFSKKNNSLANYNKTILEQNSKLMNIQSYFLGFDHSYISTLFIDGSTYIFRQTNNGEVYKKSISNSSLLFENIDVKIIINEVNLKNSWIEIIHNQTQLPNGGTISNLKTGSSVSMDKIDIAKMQKVSSLGLANFPNAKSDYSKTYFRLIIIDNDGFTFAIGRGPLKK